MINVFAVFTGKVLQTLQNTSFHKSCFLEAKLNVLGYLADLIHDGYYDTSSKRSHLISMADAHRVYIRYKTSTSHYTLIS